MNRDEIKKAVADAVVSFARSEAEAAIKSIDLDDVQKLVEAQMKNLTDPLEAEIQTTTSWWVKIRNRLYITLMQQAVKASCVNVKQKMHEKSRYGTSGRMFCTGFLCYNEK